MPTNQIVKALPYGLLTLIAIAGWTMDSPAVLVMVVLGTVCVGMFPAMMTRRPGPGRNDPTAI